MQQTPARAAEIKLYIHEDSSFIAIAVAIFMNANPFFAARFFFGKVTA